MDRLDRFFGVHGAALELRSERMQILASNIANAATPGYNPNSPVQVLGAGALDEQAKQQLTEEERGQLTL